MVRKPSPRLAGTGRWKASNCWRIQASVTAKGYPSDGGRGWTVLVMASAVVVSMFRAPRTVSLSARCRIVGTRR